MVELKHKLEIMERQLQERNELKEIVTKIIALTKENSELKMEMNKKNLETEHQQQLIHDLRQHLAQQEQVWSARHREE